MIPWVFGCVCFVHVHHLENKLSPHALKCVFVGYSRTQKGYKCFPPPHKFYVSADVTFFESSPCFSPNGTSLDGSILETSTPIPVFFPPESSFLLLPQLNFMSHMVWIPILLRLPIYLCRCLILLFHVEVIVPQCPLPGTP